MLGEFFGKRCLIYFIKLKLYYYLYFDSEIEDI